MTKNTIAIRSHIKLEDIADLLDSASRGIEYWAGQNDLGFDSAVKKALSEKGTEIQDWEGGDDLNPKIYVLDIGKIKRGLTVMAKKEPSHFADFVGGDYDQVTGDVFVQCCLFGEVLYG